MTRTRAYVHLEVLVDVERYSVRQIHRAIAVAAILGRGRFVLCEPPAGHRDV